MSSVWHGFNDKKDTREKMKKLKTIFFWFTELLIHPIQFFRMLRICLSNFSDLLKRENKICLMFRNDSPKSQVATVCLEDCIFQMPRKAVPSFLNQWQEIFLDKEYLFHTESDKPIILDLGSNVGTSIIFFSKHFPNAIIEGYEADPNIYAYLKSNMLNNDVKVQLYNAAVWINNGNCLFHSDGTDGGHLIIKESKNDISVSCIDILDIVRKYPEIDFLKIDIEGAEYEVIKRMNNYLCNVKHLFIEYHEKRTEKQKLSEILSIISENDLRYTIFNLAAKVYNPFCEIWHHEDYSQQLIIYASKWGT